MNAPTDFYTFFCLFKITRVGDGPQRFYEDLLRHLMINSVKILSEMTYKF